jgi:hypothetical protein
MRIGHVATVVALAAVGCACAAPAAGAATCSYLKKTKTVTLELSANESGTLEVSGAAIMGPVGPPAAARAGGRR